MNELTLTLTVTLTLTYELEFIYDLTIYDLRFIYDGIYLRFKAQRRLFVFSTQRRRAAKFFEVLEFIAIDLR